MRLRSLLWVALLWLISALPAYATPPVPSGANAHPTVNQPVAQLAPFLQNPNMECSQGFYPPPDGTPGLIPNGWAWKILNGHPLIDSNRTHFTGYCGSGGFVEKIEGEDAWAMFSQDIETLPNPGKPFDAYIYQQATVTPGAVYSLSGWMVSFCGGTFSNPNDCPSGYYISKMLGLDPTGGTDPLAPTVIWTEDRRNFTESRWVQMRIGATAQANKVTIFARINSPFLHHGAFALIDAISLLNGPTAQFINVPAQVNGPTLNIQWNGALTPDITSIPAGTYQLYYDVDYRQGANGLWQTWIQHNTATSATFSPVCSTGSDQDYYFRVRPLAEQPEGIPGARPNHRYLGVWTQSAVVPCDMRPRIAPLVRWFSAQGAHIYLRISAYDPGGEPLTFAARGLPPGLQINAATGEITGQSPAGITGDYPVTITVSDPGLSSSLSFTWRVLDQVWYTGLPLVSR
jgi:hypothetical protein